MLARAVSIPASWTGPNRPASLPAVVLGATGASVNRALPASARTRSIPVRQSWPQPTPPARSATRRARRSVHAAPDAWPIASYHVVCSPSRCPSRKSESGHRKLNSPYPTGHLLLNTPPTLALTADLGLTCTAPPIRRGIRHNILLATYY